MQRSERRLAMGNITGSINQLHRIQKGVAWTLVRLTATALLVLAVLSAFTVSEAARDRTPPTAPSNLRVTGTTLSTVSLAWNPSTDNSGAFSYRVRHSGGFQATVSQSQTSFTWTSNLTSGQTYSFHVYAVDAAGNQSRTSNTVTVTLPRNTTPPPTPTVSVV